VTRWTLVAVSLAVGSGCTFSTGFDGTNYQCGTGGSCPPGQRCIDGTCQADSDGGDRPDGDPDAPPGSDACGSLRLLGDDFEDGVRGPPWFLIDDPGATSTETGGELVVQLAAGTGSVYGGYESRSFYDMRGSWFDSRVVEVGGHDTIVEVRDYQDRSAQLVVEDGQIGAAVFNVPNQGTRTSRPITGADAYWRIREQDGVMYWETSADRSTWNLLYQESAVLDVAHVRGLLAAGEQLAPPSQARFADVNPTPPAVGYCPAIQLSDDFAAPPFGGLWDPYWDTDCTIGESGGDLSLTFTGTSNAFCGVVSRHLYDLRSSELVIEGGGLPARTNFVTYLQAYLPEDETTVVGVALDGTSLFFSQEVGGVIMGETTLTLDPVQHRFWRIRGVDSMIEMATSPDGNTWTPRLTRAAAFDLSRLEINLGAGNYGAVPGGAVTWALPGINAN